MLEFAIWLLVGLPLLPLLITVFNLITWRRGRRLADDESITKQTVSVLIPARNEASNIEAAMRSVLASDHGPRGELIHELLVYDDGSSDSTAHIVQGIVNEDARVKLLKGVPLPKGWIGKPHACERLLEAASGELLLYMDADVRLLPGGLERLLSLTMRPACGQVISAVPRQQVGSFFERLVLPLLILTYTSWLPLRLVEKGRSPKTVAANGQLMLMTRVNCHSLGGFSQVKGEIVDDVAFCRLAKTNGLRVVFADGFHIASCRMYRSAAEVWRGFSKNLYEGLGESPMNLALAIALHLAAFVLPYVILLVLSAAPSLGGSSQLWNAALLGVFINLGLRISLALRFKQPLEGIVLHPLSVLTLCALAVNSFLWARRGKIEWAGRNYLARASRLKELV